MKNILQKIVCILLMLSLFNAYNASLLGLAYAESSTKTFYVASNGNDQWTGGLPTPDLSGKDGPLATLQKARNAIRELRKSGSQDAFTVLVRDGVYYLNETFILRPEDSGTESHPLVFRAFENEHPILSGTKIIDNFKLYKDQIYKADLTGITNKISPVRQLFADGNRQVLARYPNFNSLDPIGGGFLYVESPVQARSQREFRYQDGSVHKWSNLQCAEVVIFEGSNWNNSIVPVLQIKMDSRVITLTKNTSREIKSNNRYYFQNILEELDSPGEWYFDPEKHELYFWSPSKTALQSAYIPVLEHIVKVEGSTSDIRFEGFTLEGCEGSAIVVNGANRIVIAGNTIFNAGSHGIDIQNGFENAAVGNDIYEVGGVGIKIFGGDRKTLTPANHRAENNYIHDIGVFLKTSSGIYCRGVGSVISHNLIHSTPRVGIWFDGNDHLIEYNHIHHVNQETEDSGMIYCSQIDWTKRGNVIQYNYLHDSGGYGRNSATGAWQTPWRTYGIYLDDWSSDTKVYGNIVTNTANGGIFIHGGRDNIVENNVIIEGGHLGQMVYSAWLPGHPVAQKWLPVMFAKIQEMGYTKYPLLSTIKDVQSGATMSGNSFVRNIIYYVSQNGVLYDINNDMDFATTISDYNIIYHSGLPLRVSLFGATGEQQWITWKDKGLDQHSIIADPLFSDVVRSDFTLSPDSPALKMGFKPIPFDKIGPYKDPLRARWPTGGPQSPKGLLILE